MHGHSTLNVKYNTCNVDLALPPRLFGIIVGIGGIGGIRKGKEMKG